MKLIRFPGGTKQVTGSTDPDPNLKLAVGPVSFTCTSCDESATVHFHNMVFRSLEFYCLSCGSPPTGLDPATIKHIIDIR